MKEPLEMAISEIIEEMKKPSPNFEYVGKRLVSYINYGSKYVVLKPSIKIQIELTNGRVLSIDATDYFEGAQ